MKLDVYDLARQDLGEGGIEVCTRSTIFQSEFLHLKIPLVSPL